MTDRQLKNTIYKCRLRLADTLLFSIELSEEVEARKDISPDTAVSLSDEVKETLRTMEDVKLNLTNLRTQLSLITNLKLL